MLGNPQGNVTMVEFFDYNCGYCKHAMSDMLTLLKTDPNLKFVLKEFPVLGEGSVEAAHVAVAARMQDATGKKYIEFHQKLLGGRGPADKARALAVAKDVGFDMARLEKDMGSDEVKKTIDENLKLADLIGVNGTPSYVVGDEVVVGAVGLDALKEKIAAERKVAGRRRFRPTRNLTGAIFRRARRLPLSGPFPINGPTQRAAARDGPASSRMSKTIYILNGPNLNLLGTRQPEIYGRATLADVEKLCRAAAAQHGLAIEFRQSNHEGQIIDWIQEARAEKAAGLIINPAGYTHTSVAILDALLDARCASHRGAYQRYSLTRAVSSPFLCFASRACGHFRRRHRRLCSRHRRDCRNDRRRSARKGVIVARSSGTSPKTPAIDRDAIRELARLSRRNRAHRDRAAARRRPHPRGAKSDRRAHAVGPRCRSLPSPKR